MASLKAQIVWHDDSGTEKVFNLTSGSQSTSYTISRLKGSLKVVKGYPKKSSARTNLALLSKLPKILYQR